MALVVKESTCQCRRRNRSGFNPWFGKMHGGGHGDPLQHSCLVNPLGQRSLAGYSPKSQTCLKQLQSVSQFSNSVVSDSLRPHGLQHTRPPCPSPTPGVHSDSCPLSQWCHPTISSSVVPFSFCLQSFPASGSFQMSQLFASGGQSTGVSASTSVLPMNIQYWFPLGWTSWISLSPRVSQESSPIPQFKSINSSVLSFLLLSTHNFQ